MDVIIGALLQGLVLPGAVAAGLLAFLWRPWDKGEAVRAAAWPGGLSLAVGFACAHFALAGRSPFPPPGGTGWLFYLALAGGVLGAGRSHLLGRPWLYRAVCIAVALGALALLLRPMFAYHWEGTQGALWLAGLGVLIAALWESLEQVEPELPPSAILATLVLTMGAAALTLLLSGTALLSQLAGALAAAAVGGWAVAWWGESPGRLLRAALPVFSLLLPGLLVCGYFYAELSGPCALLLALAPGGLWAARLPALRMKSGAARGLLAAAAVLLPLGAAVAIALVKTLQQLSEPGYGY